MNEDYRQSIKKTCEFRVTIGILEHLILISNVGTSNQWIND